MKKKIQSILFLTFLVLMGSCAKVQKKEDNNLKIHKELTAADILGNPKYLAISYGGYREKSRDIQPTIAQIKEDMKLLFAMGIRIVRTYNVQLKHAPNLLEAIHQLKKEDANFEMYVMLGAWIDCLNAWTDKEPNHDVESAQNEGEIARAVALANKYPNIVKVVAVGNEAMVRWAASYYVQPNVILKWVNHLQDLKKSKKLPTDLWITCSDDFSSWGGETSYHTEDLEKLMKAVDYISMHTYPYHNSHYNPEFWKVPNYERILTKKQKVNSAMLRAKRFSISQYRSVLNYMTSLGIDKPIHIGETGWASVSNGHYGENGSRATDEYKQGLFYKHMREWSNEKGISCFYFEAFDEQWKDAGNSLGSENHFGLINLKGEAKFSLWNLVDQGAFNGLTRDGKTITKTYNGNQDQLMKDVLVPNTDYNR